MRPSRERGVDTTAKGVPRSFSAAGIQLKDIGRVPMLITHRQWPWRADSIYLFGRDAQGNRDAAQVFIEVYQIPGGAAEFQKDFDVYWKRKKGFLIEGSKFDQTLLLPQKVSADFERESFQVRDGIHRRRIVHLFRAPDRAVLLVYSLRSAHFASSVFFRQVSESLEIKKR